MQKVTTAAAAPLEANWTDSAAAATVPLGPSLHACVITGVFTLEWGLLHAWDLALTPAAGGAPRSLSDADVIAPGKPLADELNAGGGLPRFLAPPRTLAELRVVHGSCRKANGQSLDALALVET